jgi:hypothetical protein
MNNKHKLLAVITAVIAADLIHYLITMRNIESGAYSNGADSVMWVLYCKLLYSLFTTASLTAAIFIPKRNFILAAIAFALPVSAAYMMAGFVKDWAIPNHYPVAFGYALVFVVAASLAVSNSRVLSPNHSFKADK